MPRPFLIASGGSSKRLKVRPALIGRIVNLIRERGPTLRSFAQQAAIVGDVRLSVYVDEAGTVTEVQVLSGHPLLAEEAERNVKRWQFKPGNPGNLEVTLRV